MPLISVIIPAFNAERYIADAVKSITSQTFWDMEIIVINDGSTDNTAEILADLRRNDSRIKTLHQANTGIVGALNAGINSSDSKYIVRMDADDISMPDRIASQLNVIEGDDKIAVCGSNILKFGAYSQRTHYPLTDADCKATLLLNNCFAHPTVIIRRSTLAQLGDSPYKVGYPYAEDYKLWSDLAQFGKFRNIRKPLLKYRIHPTQSGSVRRDLQREAHLKIAIENLQSMGIDCFTKSQLRSLIWCDESIQYRETFKTAWKYFVQLGQHKQFSASTAAIFARQLIRIVAKRRSYI